MLTGVQRACPRNRLSCEGHLRQWSLNFPFFGLEVALTYGRAFAPSTCIQLDYLIVFVD